MTLAAPIGQVYIYIGGKQTRWEGVVLSLSKWLLDACEYAILRLAVTYLPFPVMVIVRLSKKQVGQSTTQLQQYLQSIHFGDVCVIMDNQHSNYSIP